MFGKSRSRKTSQAEATTDTVPTANTVLATTRVSLDVAHRVRFIARSSGVTESEVLRTFIEEGCKSHRTLSEMLAEEAMRVRDQF